MSTPDYKKKQEGPNTKDPSEPFQHASRSSKHIGASTLSITWKAWLKRGMIVAAIVVLLLGIWFAYTQLKIAEGGGPARLDSKADVGIILGSSLWGDVPSPSLKERLNLVLQQYNEGRFDQIIVTGGLDTPQSRYTEAEGSKLYLIEQGIAEDRIWLESKSTSTLENLKFAKSIMTEQNWSSATIMTHDYHGMRSREIAEALDYESIEVLTIKSKVLSPIWHPIRESLAYTKWKWDELWL